MLFGEYDCSFLAGSIFAVRGDNLQMKVIAVAEWEVIFSVRNDDIWKALHISTKTCKLILFNSEITMMFCF